MPMPPELRLRDATPDDLPLVHRFVRELADYEKLLHEAVATEEDFRRLLFGEPPRAWCLPACSTPSRKRGIRWRPRSTSCWPRWAHLIRR